MRDYYSPYSLGAPPAGFTPIDPTTLRPTRLEAAITQLREQVDARDATIASLVQCLDTERSARVRAERERDALVRAARASWEAGR